MLSPKTSSYLESGLRSGPKTCIGPHQHRHDHARLEPDESAEKPKWTGLLPPADKVKATKAYHSMLLVPQTLPDMHAV